jgi:sphingolipid delta-4 desaturase
MDPDVASLWEGRIFRNPLLKLVWLIIQPATYAFRPLFLQPLPWTRPELVQWVVQIATDAAVLYFMGFYAFLYLLLGTLIGGGLHPMSGHYIAEHYEWAKGYETFSYYGWFGNFFGWNVGFHNEHHDFPRVPYTKLPALKKLAPDFYDDRPFHTSWVALMWQFVWDPNMTPFRRQIRAYKKNEAKSVTTCDVLMRDAAAEDVETVENNLAALAEKKGASSASN